MTRWDDPVRTLRTPAQQKGTCSPPLDWLIVPNAYYTPLVFENRVTCTCIYLKANLASVTNASHSEWRNLCVWIRAGSSAAVANAPSTHDWEMCGTRCGTSTCFCCWGTFRAATGNQTNKECPVSRVKVGAGHAEPAGLLVPRARACWWMTLTVPADAMTLSFRPCLRAPSLAPSLCGSVVPTELAQIGVPPVCCSCWEGTSLHI